MRGALSGLRVIDSTTMVAMPTAMHIMADMGAEVIKVETHTLFRTEAARLMYADNDPGDQPWNRDGAFNTVQRSKLGLTLNLKIKEGVEAFKDLVRVSDVVVENNRAGTMDRLGLGYEELKRIKPDLIYLSNTGFGHTGPWKSYAGIGRMFELTCGLSNFTGYLDEGPRRVGKAFFDLHVGWTAVFAILAALHYRQRTGIGQWIDFAMYQVGVSTMGDVILDFISNGRNGSVMGNRHPYMAPHGVYPCKGNDRWIAIAVENDKQWLALSYIIDQRVWTDRVEFASMNSRWRNQDELDHYISQWTKYLSDEVLMKILQGQGVPAASIMNSRDILTDPHMRARGFYELIKHSPETGMGSKLYYGRPWKMSKTPSYVRTPAPKLGEHNELILGDLLGRTVNEIAELYELGVAGIAPTNPSMYKPPTYEEQLNDGTLEGYDQNFNEILGSE